MPADLCLFSRAIELAQLFQGVNGAALCERQAAVSLPGPAAPVKRLSAIYRPLKFRLQVILGGFLNADEIEIFYRNLQRVLAPGGIFYTSVTR